MDKQLEEQKRLNQHYAKEKDWLRWGPYLSERQWGTVREDYSANGDAWNYFPHDHARSRAYRWGEDGLAGIADRNCNICFAIGLWNGKDPIIKERLFGLTGPEGNHGEDVKELYYHLDNAPTHSYMKYLYKYPHNAYPYADLVDTNKAKGKLDPEYEILDTGVFNNNAYFDVSVAYAKQDTDDIGIKITIENRGEAAKLFVLPTLWIRNLWSFKDMPFKPSIEKRGEDNKSYLAVQHPYTDELFLYYKDANEVFFTENETNTHRIYKEENDTPYKKDLFNDALLSGDYTLPTTQQKGTKSSPLYEVALEKEGKAEIFLRLANKEIAAPFEADFYDNFQKRKEEIDQFYDALLTQAKEEERVIARQAFSGLLWSKQYYNYDVETWLNGDPNQVKPPEERYKGRNSNWLTLRNYDILLMPDPWEYPWYAAWDSAFHCTTLALVDHEMAKQQLLLFTKEWYMAPNGQIPAYEWSFSDVNPPVQAWATLQIYKIQQQKTGTKDVDFLKRMFNKLALNFTWWVNREDSTENNVFEGGFLGLDNIGVFDRSEGISENSHLEQVDGTSWMALYCLNMLEMSLEIAMEDKSYEDMATKYLGHFVFIAEALNKRSIEYAGTWDNEEGFFYDRLVFNDGGYVPIKVRSIVGLLSMVAVLTIKQETLDKLPRFKDSIRWFRRHRRENLKYEVIQDFVEGDDILLSLVPQDRMKILMKAFLDENEFLSPHGIRSLSKIHTKPYTINIKGVDYTINYEPAESSTSLFGGNSNWRGPIWMPVNYLFINALKEYHAYCGDSFTVEYPTGSGNQLNLLEVSKELSNRLISLFKVNQEGNRPINGLHKEMYKDDYFKDLILFYEYFDGDNGRGVGASHQTGWTALVANLILETANK